MTPLISCIGMFATFSFSFLFWYRLDLNACSMSVNEVFFSFYTRDKQNCLTGKEWWREPNVTTKLPHIEPTIFMPPKINNEYKAWVASNYAGDNDIVWCLTALCLIRTYYRIRIIIVDDGVCICQKMGGVKMTKSMYPFFYIKMRNYCSSVCVCVGLHNAIIERNWQSACTVFIRHRGEDEKERHTQKCVLTANWALKRKNDNINKSLDAAPCLQGDNIQLSPFVVCSCFRHFADAHSTHFHPLSFSNCSFFSRKNYC